MDKEAGAHDRTLVTGMECGLKELYRDDPRLAWQDWAPDDIDIDPEESSDAKKYAIIVRREKRLEGQSSLVLHSITIQSPFLRTVLGDVFDGYKGITTKLKDLTFCTPFYEFFYRWDRLQQRIREEMNDLVLEHIKILHTILSAEIKPHLEKRQELLHNGLVTYDYLWALFEPGAVIHTLLDGQDRLYRLIDSKYRNQREDRFFSLTCRYVDCDGSSFGYVTATLRLEHFDGIKPISELSIVPLNLQRQIREIQEKLWKRGEAFKQLNGFHYKSYSGLCIMMRGYFPGPNRRSASQCNCSVAST